MVSINLQLSLSVSGCLYQSPLSLLVYSGDYQPLYQSLLASLPLSSCYKPLPSETARSIGDCMSQVATCRDHWRLWETSRGIWRLQGAGRDCYRLIGDLKTARDLHVETIRDCMRLVVACKIHWRQRGTSRDTWETARDWRGTARDYWRLVVGLETTRDW